MIVIGKFARFNTADVKYDNKVVIFPVLVDYYERLPYNRFAAEVVEYDINVVARLEFVTYALKLEVSA